VSENAVLGAGAERNKVTKSWIKFHNEEIYDCILSRINNGNKQEVGYRI
jgi:hypothetical protein